MKEELNRYVIGKHSTIVEALQKINEGANGIVFVCENDRLVGAISDGDIRRYLIEQGDLTASVAQIINYKPHFLARGQEREAVEYMRRHTITALPIVDEEQRIVSIKFLIKKEKKVEERLGIPVVIMAGGQGARLKPYTDILPKPLIPIGDKTITEHIMSRFEQYGCDEFTMIVNYKKNFIKAYFADKTYDKEESWSKGKKVQFLEEEEYLGTGGGLRLLNNKIDGTFFMTNCDILIDADYSNMLSYHKESGNIITMVCVQKKVVIPYGVVDIDDNNQILAIKEKPQFDFNTNTGLYIIEPAFLEHIAENTSIDLTDIILECIHNKDKVGVYLLEEEQWMDMGQLEELDKMKEKMGL